MTNPKKSGWMLAGGAGVAVASMLIFSGPLIAKGAPTSPVPAETSQTYAPGSPAIGNWGVDLTARDTSITPGNDFWAYASGNWAKTATIRPDQTQNSSFLNLSLAAKENERKLIDQLAAQNPAPGTSDRKVVDLYASWMNTAAIEQRGIGVLAPYLAPINAVRTRAELITLWTQTQYDGPFSIGVEADPADSSRYVVGLYQGGLGLPDRDYYLLTGEKYDTIRAAYRAYLAQMFVLTGVAPNADQARLRADTVYKLEESIAKAHWSAERSSDVTQTMNPMTLAQLEKLAPQYEWGRLIGGLGLTAPTKIIVNQPSEIADTGKLLESAPIATWRDYVTARFISRYARYLPKAIDDANFAFYGQTLRGQQTQKERWDRGISLVNDAMGEAIGERYVERYYPPAAKAKMDDLIRNIQGSLRQRIADNSWMDAKTKQAAQAKLTAFVPQIGHPDKYIDYSALVIKPDDLLGNAVRSDQFDWSLWVQRYPNPVDRGLWFMAPQEVNAYYNPQSNQITFPAAILQPPFFDMNADAAVNYGAIGAVIGHEIGHGFDDDGRHYGPTGLFVDWWTPASAAKFDALTQRLVDQYNGIEGLPGLKVNGRLTLGENIGDLSGVETAYGAWRRYVAEHGEPPVIDGLTGDQRFFLSYAQVWRAIVSEGAARERLLTDPHSPPTARVNGIVRNVDAWYKAFDVKPGDALYLPPDQRVRVW